MVVPLVASRMFVGQTDGLPKTDGRGHLKLTEQSLKEKEDAVEAAAVKRPFWKKPQMTMDHVFFSFSPVGRQKRAKVLVF